MNDWNIQSRAHQCQACGRPFADREAYHTLLFDEKRDYLRLDVCEPCWKNQYSQGANERKGFISHWQGVYEVPPLAAPDPIQKATAETLLRKLIALNDPRFAAASFILAVMLERKRLLKVKEQIHHEGRRIFIYEQPATGDLFTIADPQLQLNQIEQVQREVGELLDHGLPGEAAPPGPETTDCLCGGLAVGAEVATTESTAGPPALPVAVEVASMPLEQPSSP